MTVTELAERVGATLELDVDEFQGRVDEEAADLKREIRAGTFDNPQALVGLEYELYGVDDGTDELVRVPRDLLEYIGFEAELGLHNAEMHTTPQPLNEFGVASQETEVQARLAAANDRARVDDIRLVSDGMWTVPPRGESATAYLDDAVDVDGVRLSTNMSKSLRYQTFLNADIRLGRRIDVPGVDRAFDTVLAESLTTSIQPHYQVPRAAELPEYFAYAIRVAPALLALGVNSPFLPPELYDADAETVLDEGYRENRIPVFEGMLNPADRPDKVRFPRDVPDVEAAVDRIADDPVIVPAELEPTGRYDDRFRHLRHKHGAYWRWVRPVFDGATAADANARIEFRALPAQPTVRDSVAFLAAFAGLLEGLHRADHPLRDLPWDVAREDFYAAMREGLDAELRWVTADGSETTDPEVRHEELFDLARDGLVACGLTRGAAREYLRPLRGRYRHGTAPADWKRREVRRRLDAGQPLPAAIREMQSEYHRRQRRSLLRGTFVDWLTDRLAVTGSGRTPGRR